MKNIATIIIILFSLVLVSCENDTENIKKENVGFMEYQYSFLLNGVNKTGYKRFNLNRAFFKLYTDNSLSQELKDAGLRKVELFIVSDSFNSDSLLKPLSQVNKTSYIQITLVDSLGNNNDNKRLLPYRYNTVSMDALAVSKKPACTSVLSYMNMRLDTITNTQKYEYNFVGQSDKMVSVIYLGADIFQIISNGVYNGKTYNVYYMGEIKQEEDLK